MAAEKSKGIVAQVVIDHPLMDEEERNSLQPVEEEPSCWGDCPLDILLLVFERLEPVDLMSCIEVNYHWKDAVNYIGVHCGIWKQLAQAGMVNKGIDLRRRANPKLDWRNIYINYRLWHMVERAQLTWTYELTSRDIKHLHVYKDILIMESDEDFFKKYYHIDDRLVDVTKKLIDSAEAEIDVVEQAINGEANTDADVVPCENLENDVTEQECSYMTDKMIKMLVKEAPFTRLLVLDEECYYMLNQQNILRCSKWDETNQRWLAYVLARYYMCNKSISDISVYNDDVYMLLKTGLLFKLDRAGRNFLPDRRFNAYLTPAQFEVSRMIYGEIDSSIEKAGAVNLPEYETGTKVMFQKISVVVSVPQDKQFKMNVEENTGNIVLEYPGLTCATQHGDVLFLGFMDGKVEICLANNLIQNGGRCEISTKVPDCLDYPTGETENPAIASIEVYEDLHSHHIFVATHSHLYRLTVTYPQYVKDGLGLIKDFVTDD